MVYFLFVLRGANMTPLETESSVRIWIDLNVTLFPVQVS